MPGIPTPRRILKTNCVIPVNLSYQEVLGRKCYRSLREIPEQVDIVDILRDMDQALAAAHQAQ